MNIEWNEEVNEPELYERDTATLLLDLMLHSLLVPDKELNTIAIELLTRFGERGFRRLLTVACDTGNSPEHRINALLVIKGLGVIPDRQSYLDLLILTQDRDNDVREVAAELVKTLRRLPGCLFPDATCEEPEAWSIGVGL